MKIKEYNKQKIDLKWIQWKYDIFWSNRCNYERDEFGNYYGKEYRQDQAMLKVLTKMIRKYYAKI